MENRAGRIDFDKINRAALADLPSVLRRWLPDGRVIGAELQARNPRRVDRRAGSFKINVCFGRCNAPPPSSHSVRSGEANG